MKIDLVEMGMLVRLKYVSKTKTRVTSICKKKTDKH